MKKTILITIISISIIFVGLLTTSAQINPEIEKLETRKQAAIQLEQIIVRYISIFENIEGKEENLKRLNQLHQLIKEIRSNTKEELMTYHDNEMLSSEIVDCGKIGPENPEDEEMVMSCWDLKFKKCTPAKIITSIDFSPLDSRITYYSEIIGPKDNFCSVKSQYLKAPNPDWINKEMICNYDNSIDFDVAIQDIGKCSGPLYEIITEGMHIHEY